MVGRYTGLVWAVDGRTASSPIQVPAEGLVECLGLGDVADAKVMRLRHLRHHHPPTAPPAERDIRMAAVQVEADGGQLAELVALPSRGS